VVTHEAAEVVRCPGRQSGPPVHGDPGPVGHTVAGRQRRVRQIARFIIGRAKLAENGTRRR